MTKLFGVSRERDLALRGFKQEARLAFHTGPVTATGGNKYTPGDGYIYHAFTNSMNSGPTGSYVQASGGDTVNFLIVAGGGGGGGGYYAGGGGGGGCLEGFFLLHQPGTYVITAGAGGVAGVDRDGTAATNGGNSIFHTLTAIGGGSGGSGPGTNDDGGDGGSGGGASYYVYPGVGSAIVTPGPLPGVSYPTGTYTAYGNDGGLSRSPSIVGAGGGGAGGQGPVTAMINAGDGQAFPNWPSAVIPILVPLNPIMGASNNTYGGGGGGGPWGTKGDGGGGTAPSGVGIDYLGGGGAGNGTNPGTGGVGGDGIVLIRYSAT